IACSSPARRVRAAIIPPRTALISLEWPRRTKRSPHGVANARRETRPPHACEADDLNSRRAPRRVSALWSNTRRSPSFPAMCEPDGGVGANIDAELPGKGNAFLRPRLFVVCRLCRQLQHGCLLAFAQEGQKQSLPIRQLERIMVHMRLFTIDLAKNCRL